MARFRGPGLCFLKIVVAVMFSKTICRLAFSTSFPSLIQVKDRRKEQYVSESTADTVCESVLMLWSAVVAKKGIKIVTFCTLTAVHSLS